jgi:hypothetical protein
LPWYFWESWSIWAPGLQTPYGLHDPAAGLGVVVGVLLVADCEGDPRVALDVLELLAVNLGVYHQALAVGVDPDQLRLKIAAR